MRPIICTALARHSMFCGRSGCSPRRCACAGPCAPFPRDDFGYMDCAVTNDESKILLDEFLPKLKRRRYEGEHWDGAIVNFREFENREWRSEAARLIVARLERRIEDIVGRELTFLPRVHVIDLADTGFINPHVDSVKFSGGVVAGLSLLTDAVMRFRPANLELGTPISGLEPTDFVVAQNSLYVMSGQVRFEYTHEVLPRNPPARRLSVMFRDVLAS